MKICEYKKEIAECIMKHYSNPEEISGCDLHDLGEWIDIIKDIAEMQYYEAKAKKENAVVDAMHDNENEERTVISVIQSLTNMIEDSISTMSERDKMIAKSKLESLVNSMR